MSRKQHAPIAPIAVAEKTDRTAESRRASAKVNVTEPCKINHDAHKTAEDRRQDALRANGHKSSEGKGLASAAAEEGRACKEK